MQNRWTAQEYAPDVILQVFSLPKIASVGTLSASVSIVPNANCWGFYIMDFSRSIGSLALIITVCTSLGAVVQPSPQAALAMMGAPHAKQNSKNNPSPDSGELNAIDATGRDLGKCPLKHTSINAKVSGYVSRVTVEQTFTNPYPNTIEAIYTFPLSDGGAVNEMVMKIGPRTVRGVIQSKDEARQMYETAKRQGRIASLLDQERTNIFTQSVANIPPNETVKIEIKYVEYLPYESGHYQFVFPMVVGPRYIPGHPIGKTGTGYANNTDRVKDASKITPPVMAEDTRAGHDISLHLSLDAGMPIQSIESKLHKVTIKKSTNSTADVEISPSDSIPNKDFVLDWKVATDSIRPGYVAHKTGNMGFFSVMLLPPAQVTPAQICPRELNFIVDRSGSQRGLPLQKARETMLYILDRLNPNDTFQVLSFSNSTERLFKEPMKVTAQNASEAKKYVAALDADGGTEMREAVETATATPAPENRLRIFVLMTDGYIGNDQEIIGMVKQTRGVSRWFTFGTGNSVNRMLIDGVAKAGGGESDYVYLNSPGEEVAKKFFNKISSPVLTDVKVKFNGVDVADVQPAHIDDLWAQRPIYITGKYLTPGTGSVTIQGFSAGKPYTSTLPLQLPDKESVNEVLPSVWARTRVEDLMQLTYAKSLTPIVTEAKNIVEKFGLFYHLLTAYTSFVAIDDSKGRQNPTQQTVTVGVEAPDGVSLKKIFGTPGGGQSNTGSLKLPAEIGRVEGPRDISMFQVEPTVIDERHYTSGTAERHQKTSPTLPEGAPIPDTSINQPPATGGQMAQSSSVDKYTFFTSGASYAGAQRSKAIGAGTGAALGTAVGAISDSGTGRGAWSGTAIGSGSGIGIGAAIGGGPGTASPLSRKYAGSARGRKVESERTANAKVAFELQERLSETDKTARLILKVKVENVDPATLAKIKTLADVRILESHPGKNEIIICAPAMAVSSLADLKGVLLVSSADN